MIAEGMIILNDFDNTKKTKKPAIRQNVDVLVPEANICQITIIEVIRKKNLSFLILLVMPITKKVIAAQAAWIP